MPSIPRVFIAYSRQDSDLLDKLRTNLVVLERKQMCSIFYDGVIQAGDRWDKRIKDELHAADIFLLLVSPDFLASEYIHEIELPTILKREQAGSARVLPVILKHCSGKWSDLSQFQAILYKESPIEVHQAYWHVVDVLGDAILQMKEGKVVIHPAPPTIDPDPIDPFQKDMIFIQGGVLRWVMFSTKAILMKNQYKRYKSPIFTFHATP